MPVKLSKKSLPYVALVVVVVGAGLYYLWGRPSETGPVVTSEATPQSSSEATFLGLANELNTVSFDSTLFSDPRFTSLKDIHTNIVAEPIGRRDPFGGLAGIKP